MWRMGNALTALNLSLASVVTTDLILGQGMSWATVSWVDSRKFLPFALEEPWFPSGVRNQTSREDSVILGEVSIAQKIMENLPLAEKKMNR
jgi:hypothetical protein